MTNLRLPGQYDERLLGSLGLQGPYYNRNRWYLPGVGRYLELDPLALTAAFNGPFSPDWYGYALGNPLRWIDPQGLVVYKCCRTVHTGVPWQDAASAALGLQHCWLKTDTSACGMGPAGGGPLPNNPFGVDTQINDHSGEPPGFHCEKVDTDEDCVNSKCKKGGRTGKFGLRNNCNTWADRTIGDCQRSGSWTGGGGGGGGGSCGCRGASGGW